MTCVRGNPVEMAVSRNFLAISEEDFSWLRCEFLKIWRSLLCVFFKQREPGAPPEEEQGGEG